MLIEDEELRQLYKTAAEEHLQKLEAGLLHLEKHPEDPSPFEELLREAHSLKGDSRMLGLNDIEKFVHQIEHIFGSLKRGEEQLTSELSDRLYQGLDVIAKLVQEAVTGESLGIDTFHALARLMGSPPVPAITKDPEPPPVEDEKIEAKPEPEREQEQPPALELSQSETVTPELDTTPETSPEPPPTPETAKETPISLQVVPEPVINPAPLEVAKPRTPATTNRGQTSEPYRIETIRVETRHLDDLITQTGELAVTKIRIAHVATELEELRALWEEWKSSHDYRHNLETLARPIEERLQEIIDRLHLSARENSARLDLIAGDLEERIRTLRLLPLVNLFQMFPRLVRDLSRQQNKEVDLIIEGGETTADKRILEEMKDPLIHLIRNAIDHGIETPQERERLGKPPTATIYLKGSQTTTHVIIEVTDDGRGLDQEKIKRTAIDRGLYRPEELVAMTPQQIYHLIFLPGFTTQTMITEVSGRGVGLDVVHTNVERLKGTIQVESHPGQGVTFRIQLGTTLATANVLLVEVQGLTHGLPIEFVETTFLVAPEEIFTIEGRETIALEGQAISVAKLADLLEISQQSLRGTSILNAERHRRQGLPCILLKIGEERFGLFVDALLDSQDVTIKPQSRLLERVRNVAGATILGTGDVCSILNPVDLLKSVQRKGIRKVLTEVKEIISQQPVILLVEDSIAIRTQEKRILEGAGYEVVTAVDGLDGLNKLKTRKFEAVISDIQMPNLDGLELTQRIRSLPEYNELPIILVTSLASDEDKKRGAEAGANAYITKGAFNQEVLLDTLDRLI